MRDMCEQASQKMSWKVTESFQSGMCERGYCPPVGQFDKNYSNLHIIADFLEFMPDSDIHDDT